MFEEYICACCHHRFRTTWSDEEAEAEADVIFGPLQPGQAEVVLCEDCFRELGFERSH